MRVHAASELGADRSPTDTRAEMTSHHAISCHIISFAEFHLRVQHAYQHYTPVRAAHVSSHATAASHGCSLSYDDTRAALSLSEGSDPNPNPNPNPSGHSCCPVSLILP